jgi:hypothetical protein
LAIKKTAMAITRQAMPMLTTHWVTNRALRAAASIFFLGCAQENDLLFEQAA